MWLFTRYGFYSVVQKKAGEYQIRGRLESHLAALKSLCDVRGPIVRTPHNDYRYRIVVSAWTWKRIASILAAEVEYSNFKSEVARVQGYDEYERALHAVWRLMHALQTKHERPAGNAATRAAPEGKFPAAASTASDPVDTPF